MITVLPGPLLFAHEPALVWGVIASLYVGNIMLLILNLPLVGLWVKLLSIPRPWLYGGILVVSDHASNRVPEDIRLGIDPALLFLGHLGTRSLLAIVRVMAGRSESSTNCVRVTRWS